ncbi:DUF4234 domain-containing protein [Nocardioides daejeonensis]|uniref:DUF4234 domain-containing protein n=1 Tax=Nocardioides daejeonensis TaxID=1046556 RepID=UPI00194E51E5|nr:DUF4234 domain-containing protein [Nocardioides daejeonensis]
MTDPNQPPQWQPSDQGNSWQGGQPPMGAYPVDPNMPQTPYRPMGTGELGKVRGTGVSILLFIVTLGIYGLVYWYLVHEEMKRHSGDGVGGGIALLLAFFVSPVMGFLTPNEIAELYKRQGQQPPVTALTGLWYFPGAIIIVGPIVWFVKVNGALNDYWRAMGAQG